jgi:serine/threonine-protein kinase RsbT
MPPTAPNEVRLTISSDLDIVIARQRGRELAASLGFSLTESAIVATTISELARNIVRYAKKGELWLNAVEQGARRGLQVLAKDEGPGIRDLNLAMKDGYSTSGGLGLGLPGVRRLMDEFDIVSDGHGTTVTTIKWLR